MEEGLFLLVGFIGPDGAEVDQPCFVVPVFADKEGKHFIQNAKLKKCFIPPDVEAWELKVPVGFPSIDRRDDLLYGFLMKGYVLIGPHRLLTQELRQVRKTVSFHSPQGVVIDHFINDMEKMAFADPKMPMMRFLVD
jgi:hypothetical protein